MAIEPDQARTSGHQALITVLAGGPGLILVTGPTGQGKTTLIEEVLGDVACPPDVVFIGDVRADVAETERAVQLARSQVVLAVLRIQRAAGAFARLIDMGISANELAQVTRAVFTTRLFRLRSEAVLVHEHLRVTAAIRDLVCAGADPDKVHRQALADGMRSLRQVSLGQASAGRLSLQEVVQMTPDD